VVVPKELSDRFESGDATIEDLRALLEVEAGSQGWSLDAALAWARSRKPARNYIQADIKALVSLLDLCCAA
jgi:hypothetical protein